MTSKLISIRRCFVAVSVVVGVVGSVAPALAQWVTFVDETAARNTIDPARFSTDPEEKDYAFGDVDHDGDIDLVVVRKQPFTSPGKRPNYLFINDDGVLTDRTQDFATASDVSGDLGFLTPTNDRDVVLTDVNLDDWLDIVTAPTTSDGDPKHIGHPRVYMNLGCSGACNGTNWLGFRFENDRIPTMLTYGAQSGFNPRFAAVDAGDLTGDGYPDLWFADHDSSGAGGSVEPPGADFNDKLLINQGALNPGFFFDASSGPGSHFSGTITIPGFASAPFVVSAFGAAANIKDINGDGRNDIVKQTSLNVPTYVGMAYNNPASVGFFSQYEVVYDSAPTFVSVGDLNNDNKLDLVITDDGPDRYKLNDGNDPNNMADFTEFVFAYAHIGGGSSPSGSDGFGSQSAIADLNNDGWNDVVISDVEVDISGCSRRMHIYKNLGGTPGQFVNLQEQTQGTACAWFQGNPATCQVAGIPSNMLEGTHNVAIFDLNGDGWKDMIVGRCTGTQIYINDPPLEPSGAIVDEDGDSGQALLVDKNLGRVILNWGDSCALLDTDYAVYRGNFNPSNMSANTFTNHGDVTCTTDHLTTFHFAEDSGSHYYLVVPHNGTWEGSYGLDSDGAERQQGSGGTCFPQNIGTCD